MNVITGSPAYADAHLVSSDGLVIPFHRIIFHMSSQEGKLAGCELELYIKSQWRDSQTPIPIPFDAQTVWRVLDFIYNGTYQDEDKEMDFPKIEPPVSSPSFNRLSDASLEHQEVGVIRGLHNLHLTSQSCTSRVLRKALASVKVFKAAFLWKFERLKHEASNRFGEFISGAFDQPEFPQIIAPVFNSVVDPKSMLYGHLVQECFAHCQDLVNNADFMTALEHHGTLAVELYKKLAALQASLDNGNLAKPLHASSPPDTNGSASVVDSSAITLLQIQLDDALVAASTKQEQIDALKQEISRLEKTCAEVKDADSTKQEQIDALQRENARPKENVPQKTASINLEAHVQKLRVEMNSKDAVIDNLRHQLEVKDRKVEEKNSEVEELGRALATANKRGNLMADQINKQREGQPEKTDFLLDRKEAIEKLQVRNIMSEEKIRDLETQLAAHIQQPVTVRTAFVPQPHGSNPVQSPQDAGHRRVNGFGMMASSVNTIVAASSDPPTRPPSPLPTPPVPVAPTLAAQAPRAGGAQTFIHKIRDRREAAGIHGGEAESSSSNGVPPSMTVVRRGVLTIPAASMASAANGVSSGPHSAALARRAAGPHSPQANGGAHSSSATAGVVGHPRVNGSAAIPIVDPGRSAPVAPSAAVAPAAATNGQGNAAPDARDKEIEKLRKDVKFLQGQLSDARSGPASNVQSRTQVGHGPPRNDSRLPKVLKALGEQAVDHKSCNDCGINFNSQWRGMVDNIENRDLILMCGKCGEEKCRWSC